MSFLFFASAVLAVVFAWGLLWPRSQWKVLAAWLRRNPDASEPGSTAYAAQRVVSGIGVGVFGVVGVTLGIGYAESLPAPEPPKTALQQMWGTAPRPVVVDRIVGNHGDPLPGYMPEPIHGYQVVDNTLGTPRYLVFLPHYDPPGQDEPLVGTSPGSGFAALDSSELVVNLRIKQQCTPIHAVVIETEEVVQVAVYTAVTSPVGGSTDGFDAALSSELCGTGSTMGPSILVPIDLASPVGEREVQLLDSTPIREVRAIEP